MDINKFKDLKKDIISLKETINRLISEQDEIEGDGGILDGDFDSEASETSWSEFFAWYALSPGLAIANEISTWHGERKEKLIYDPITSPFNSNKPSVPISESWEVKYITDGTKASDLIGNANVKTDETGDYFQLNTGNQTLKLYLPNSTFFSTWASLNTAYQFKTDNGTVYQLALTLESDKAINQLLSGSEDKNSSLAISMRNLNPNEGNGWSFKFESNNPYSAYWRKKGDLLETYNAGRILTKDLKSSFSLWWEHWGTTAQIVVGIAVAFLAPPLGAWIAGRAVAIWGAESAVVAFLAGNTALGVTFTADMSIVLAEFLLESAVNVPAAIIDYMEGNKYGASMGIMFCAFPMLIRAGKIGRFIDPYNDVVAKNFAKKLSEGIYENMGTRQMLKFIEGLTPQEKYIFAKGLSYLSKEGVPESINKGIKDLMEQAVKKGTFPKAFETWLKTSGRAGSLTLGAGLLYWGGSTALYAAVKTLMDENGDTRDIEEVKLAASKNAEKLIKSNSEVDEDSNLGPSSTSEILTSITDGRLSTNGPKIYYELSKGDVPSIAISKFVADKKMIEAEERIRKAKEDREFFNKTKFPSTLENFKTLNNKTTNPKPQNEINGILMNPEDMDAVDLEVILSDSNHQLSTEIQEVETAFPCLKENFDPIEGDYFFEDGGLSWFIRFKCITPITLPTWAGYNINVTKNQSIYIYKSNNGSYSFQYSANKDNILYNGFKCPN